MKNIKKFSDNRHDSQCAYCGENSTTRDHTPSKVLLESPYPKELHVVPSCYSCNNGFSMDEEYFACAIECMISGTTDLSKLSKVKIIKILKRNNNLKNRLKKSFTTKDEIVYFEIESERFKRVLHKLAYGHVKFENSQTQFIEPKNTWFKPLALLTDNENNYFFSTTELQISPEVGSRATQYMCISESGVPINNWKIIQDNIYCYSIVNNISSLKVRIIIWNYLACEIEW